MCSSYIINGQKISTQQELKNILGENPPFSVKFGMFQPEACLCPINPYKTAKILRLECGTDCNDWYFGSKEEIDLLPKSNKPLIEETDSITSD